MTKSILIIDKDPFILMVFKRILSKFKITILTAYTIEQARQRYTKKTPAIIMYDMDFKTLGTDSLKK